VNEAVRRLAKQLAQAGRCWLFLDYDGTLASFAPTPDDIFPDPELIQLVTRLAQQPERLRVVILSGRRLAHIQKLLPVPGILLAGSYGIEYQTSQGEAVQAYDPDQQRPLLDQVKAVWAGLITGRTGFFLEDKGYTVALHARHALPEEAQEVVALAERAAGQLLNDGPFRLLSGERFLEVAPQAADKGQSISSLLAEFPWPEAHIVYIGDDDKDEAAFEVVNARGGITIVVDEKLRPSQARYRLQDPGEVRQWLSRLAEQLEHNLTA
jgi:trehalose 6-phosphate phosphatase